jgi:hypothetical protein
MAARTQNSRNFYVACHCRRLRNRISICAHRGKVHLDCLLHPLPGQIECPAGRDAPREVRDIGAISCTSSLVNHCVLHRFSPACLRMLFSVPGATSSAGCPAIVTLPGLMACLYYRWLPSRPTSRQPSRSTSLMTSRTFISFSHARPHLLER